MWEHFVLNEIHAAVQGRAVGYWRDKQQHEVDFVLAADPKSPTALEAKWKADAFDPGNLLIFRKAYPDGRNFLVAQDVDRPYTRNFGPLKVRYIGLGQIPGTMRNAPGG